MKTRLLVAGLLALGGLTLCAWAPLAFGAMVSLEQAERSCENTAGPIAACIHQRILDSEIANGIAPAVARAFPDPAPLQAYYEWLGLNATRLPAKGTQRRTLIALIRSRTRDTQGALLVLYADNLANEVTSLQQQLSQAQATIAELQKAQQQRQSTEQETPQQQSPNSIGCVRAQFGALASCFRGDLDVTVPAWQTSSNVAFVNQFFLMLRVKSREVAAGRMTEQQVRQWAFRAYNALLPVVAIGNLPQ